MTQPALAAPSDPRLSAADFCAHVLADNPFLDNRSPGPAAADASTVHQAAFARLTSLADEAARTRRGVGAVLWGEAGVGKSHVLARLARWAADQAGMVYLHNLQADPTQLPRALLRAVLGVLTRGPEQYYETPLYELISAGVVQAVGGVLRHYSWETLGRAFVAWGAKADGLPGAAPIDPNIYEVLFQFYRSANRARRRREDGRTAYLAARWLSGWMLTALEGRVLGLSPGLGRDDPVGLSDAQHIKEVLCVLARLANGGGRSLILAFDQIDNLDDGQATALSRFLQALLDAAPGLFVVCAGVQETLLHWRERKVIQDSAWDRLGQFPVQLQRLTPAEAEQVLAAHLSAFAAPFADVEDVRQRRGADPLFPLSREWFERTLGSRLDLRPRDVVSWAREGWRGQQEALRAVGGDAWLEGVELAPPPPPLAEQIEPAIDLAVEARLAEQRAFRRQTPIGEPLDRDELAELLYQLLGQCQDDGAENGLVAVERGPTSSGAGARIGYDVLLTQQSGGRMVRTGVLVVTATHGNRVTSTLRRLVKTIEKVDRPFFVVDLRIGLRRGERGQQHLDAIAAGATLPAGQYALSEAEYVELEALRRAVLDARSGDLEAELAPGRLRPVTAADVIASHHRRGRYRSCELLRLLLTAPHPALPAPRLLTRNAAATTD
jgi:hypothetical protein